MASLIITIISLAIFAIVAASAIYYGGQALQNAQAQVTANAIMSEAQQILFAARLWSTNNGQPDISGMGSPGTSGTGISALVNGGELSSWPSFMGNIALSTNLTNPGPQPYIGTTTAATVTTGTDDFGCYNINGYVGRAHRFLFTYNSGIYLMYYFVPNIPYAGGACASRVGNWAASVTDASQANHPIVLIAKAINAATGAISSYASQAYMPYLGLPYQGTGGGSGFISVGGGTVYDTSGGFALNKPMMLNYTVQTNYCYYWTPSGLPIIGCVFGPS